MKDLNNHIKGDKAKWIMVAVAILLIFVILGAILALIITDTNPKDWVKKEQNKQVVADNGGLNVDIPTNDNAELKLSMASVAAETNPFIKTLQADVIGDTDNKSVNWSLAWGAESTRENESVDTYIKHSAKAISTGSILTLQCLKGFEGDTIIVTAVSVVGGDTNSCTLRFGGAPSALKIDVAGQKVVHDTAWGYDLVELEVGRGASYSFNVSLDNAIHSVGSKYGQYELIIEALGSFNTTWELSNQKQENFIVPLELQEMNIVRFFRPDMNEDGTQKLTYVYCAFGRATLEGSVLTVSPYCPTTIGYKFPAGSTHMGTSYCTINGYVDNKVPILKITVRDTVSGVSSFVCIKNVSSVTALNLNSTEIVF